MAVVYNVGLVQLASVALERLLDAHVQAVNKGTNTPEHVRVVSAKGHDRIVRVQVVFDNPSEAVFQEGTSVLAETKSQQQKSKAVGEARYAAVAKASVGLRFCRNKNKMGTGEKHTLCQGYRWRRKSS